MGLWRTCAMAWIHSFCSFSCSHMKTNRRHGVSTVMPYFHLFLRAFLGSHSFTEYPFCSVPMKMTPNSSASYIHIEKMKLKSQRSSRRDSDTHTKRLTPLTIWCLKYSNFRFPESKTNHRLLNASLCCQRGNTYKMEHHIQKNTQLHNFNDLFLYVKKNRNSE